MSDRGIQFIHTVLFKIILAFLITSIVPAGLVIGVIPQYYTRVMTENITLLNNTVVDTAVTNINTYVEDLKRLLVAPYMNSSILDSLYVLKKGYQERKTNTKEFVEAKNILAKNLPSYIQYARKDIVGILVCFDEENAMAFYPDRSTLVKEFDFGSENWYQVVIEADGKNVFISKHPQNYLNNRKDRQIFSVARVIKSLDHKQSVAMIKVDADKNLLSEIMSGIKLNVSSIMVVANQDGEVLYSNKELSEEIQKKMKENSDRISAGDQVYNVISRDVEETGWMIKALVSETEYVNQMKSMQKNVILLYLVAMGVAILIFACLSGRITKPLRVISQKMGEVENGNFDIRFHVTKRDEIAALGNSFNIMTEHLNELINKEYKAVIAAQKAEYYALQSQIEPHFLYNVLNTMVGINRMGDKKLLEDTIVSLAGMLRYMTGQADTATVAEEFDMLEKYCSLQKLRLQRRFSYKTEISDDVGSARIPKLLVQPLVENAVIHGIEPTGDEGQVSVKAFAENKDWITILVEDTGCGFDMKSVAAEKESVGLENVINRLHFFQEDARADIISEPGKGTRIILRISRTEREVEG